MKKTKISKIIARQLIDCKCRPIVEVDVITENGSIGRASAPTGTSVGKYEAFVLRDGNLHEYDGMSVHKAVENVNVIIGPSLIGMDVTDQRAIDELMISMDGTFDKSKLGSNAIYSVSAACLRAAACAMNLPVYEYIAYIAQTRLKTVPIPSFNVINGGCYGDIKLAFNEFILVPYKADTIYEAVEIGIKVYQKLGKIIATSGFGEPAIGGSYGWAAFSNDPEIVMDIMQEAVYACGYEDKVAFAIDCAMSEMYDNQTKTYFLKGKQVDSSEIISLVKRMSEQYNLVYVEDILDEDDWNGFINATKQLDRTIIIGDDFIVTNLKRLKKAYELKAVDGFILKPNQIGTITEAIDAHRFASDHGMITIPSGRSGGVVGDIIMDLAVGLQVGIIKNGAPRSGERIDKLNFLMRVASENPGTRLYDFSKHVRF